MSSVFWLITSFFKIGLFGFGGGLAILPMIFQSVTEHGQMSVSDFSNLVAISQVTPGPLAINAATYVGFDSAGVLGALLATLAVSLPGFILVNIAVHFIEKFQGSKIIEGVFTGIRPATVGLIFSCMIYVANGALVKEGWNFEKAIGDLCGYINILPIAIFICTIILVGKFKINPIIIILMMGVIGTLTYGFIL